MPGEGGYLARCLGSGGGAGATRGRVKRPLLSAAPGPWPGTGHAGSLAAGRSLAALACCVLVSSSGPRAPRARDWRARRAASMGSFSSPSPFTMSTSTAPMCCNKAARVALALLVALMLESATAMCRPRSTDMCCKSMAIAGPRSLEQPRKNVSVLMRPLWSSSSCPWSQYRSFVGISSIFIRSRTPGLFMTSTSSSMSSCPLLSVSASLKISLRDSMTIASVFSFSFALRSSFATALVRVVSTTTPTMVFNSTRTARQRKELKTSTSHGYLLISGNERESDQPSPVRTWKSEYMDRGTSPQ
mmetsp:Transcript_29905/g.95362  ORF Transcript_29905/g.95362 Transcript_29905/m.95362 type:complete len:302 (-) Transcript_29905:782-1687(-)